MKKILAILALISIVLLTMGCSNDAPIPTCTVTFDSLDESDAVSVTVVQGSKVTEPPALEKDGRIIAGWYEAGCITAWDFAVDTVSADITLYANWVEAVTVTFDSLDESDVESVTIAQDAKITEPPALVKEGHIFAGWYKDATCTAQWDFAVDTVSEDITLYANWVEAVTVTFDSQDESDVESATIAQDTKVTAPTEPVKEGHIFAGWYKESECTTPWNFSVDIVSADITLYAKWEVAVTVTFNSKGGSFLESETIAQGAKVTAPTEPVKEGHIFGGWYKAGCTTAWNFANDVVSEDITLYANWVAEVTVTFDSIGGGFLESVTIAQDTKVTAPTEPVKEGYLFGGWYKAGCTTAWDFAGDTVSEDITLYANWVAEVTVTFDSQDESTVETVTIAQGTKVTAPETPTKENYTFDGWYKEAECKTVWDFSVDTCSEDITLYAKWLADIPVTSVGTMKAIAGGTFDRSGTAITVDSFYMGATEVTNLQYYKIMGSGYENSFPKAYVSWYDAVEFCNRLSEKDGLDEVYIINKEKDDPNNTNDDDDVKWTVTADFTKNGYRLPTEAEWEYAAGGGSTNRTIYAGTSDSNELGTYAWWHENNTSTGSKNVATKKPNSLGLYDMSGNLWEWCWDWYASYDENDRDNPVGTTSGSERIIRGGCASNEDDLCKVDYRYSYSPNSDKNGFGFRVVRSL